MTGRAALARLAPSPTAALARVEQVAMQTLAERSLLLVRDRVTSLLGGVGAYDDWRDSDLFAPSERALMGFVEQFVFSVSSLGDQEVEALLEHWSPEQVHEICNVVWAVDLGTRLDLVSAAVLG